MNSIAAEDDRWAAIWGDLTEEEQELVQKEADGASDGKLDTFALLCAPHF